MAAAISRGVGNILRPREDSIKRVLPVLNKIVVEWGTAVDCELQNPAERIHEHRRVYRALFSQQAQSPLNRRLKGHCAIHMLPGVG